MPGQGASVGWRAHISTPATEDLHGDFCPATEPYYVRIAVSPNPERNCGVHRDGAHHFQRPQRPSVPLPRAPKHNSKQKISNNWSPHPSPPRQILSQDTAHLLKPSQRRGAWIHIENTISWNIYIYIYINARQQLVASSVPSRQVSRT